MASNRVPDTTDEQISVGPKFVRILLLIDTGLPFANQTTLRCPGSGTCCYPAPFRAEIHHERRVALNKDHAQLVLELAAYQPKGRMEQCTWRGLFLLGDKLRVADARTLILARPSHEKKRICAPSEE